MTVGEFQQGGIMMLKYNEVVKVMKEKSFGSELKKLLQDAENKLMEIGEVPEEELNDLQQIVQFEFWYNVENNTFVFETIPSKYDMISCRDEFQPEKCDELEIFRALSDLLEANFSKKLYSFEISFVENEMLEFEKVVRIFVKQKRMNENFFEGRYIKPEEYYEKKLGELESVLAILDVDVTDLSKEDDWMEATLVE